MSRSAVRNRAATFEARPQPAEAQREDAASDRPRWWWRHALIVHAAALAVIVLAITPLTLGSGVGWIDDEGAYALQVEALLDGRWEYGYWGADFDPDGQWQPITRAVGDGGHVYPYVKHPVYPLLLAAGAWVFGTGFGLYAIPMLGFVLAAIVAWLLAAEFESRAGPIAFWLVAGSPLLIDAYALYAHTLGAAVAGAALLIGVRILRRGLTWWRVVGFAAALSVGALLRSEAILFGVALTAVVVGTLAWQAHRTRQELLRALRRRGKGSRRPVVPDDPDTRAARAAASIGGAGVVALGVAVELERLLVRWVVGASDAASGLGARHTPGNQSLSGFLGAKWDAAWRITFSGSDALPSASRLVLWAILVVAAVAFLGRVLQRRPHGWAVMVGGAVLVCGLYVLRARSYPSYLIPGFFAAWPAALAGLAFLPWARLKHREVMAGTTLLIFTALVYATQYDIGGAVEWGGRFLALAVPGLAAVVAAGLLRQRMVQSTRRRGAGGAWVGVAVLAVILVVPAASGVAILHTHRLMNRPFHDDLASVATRVVVIDSNEPVHHGFPKLSWTLNEDHDFLLTVPGPPAAELLETLYEKGFDAVTVVHASVDPIHEHTPFQRADDVTPPHTRSIGGAIHVLRRGAGGP